MNIAPKMALEPTLGHLFSIFLPFGAMQKKHVLEAQKSDKSGRGAAKRLQVGPGTSPENGIFGIWVPGAARTRLGTRN